MEYKLSDVTMFILVLQSLGLKGSKTKTHWYTKPELWHTYIKEKKLQTISIYSPVLLKSKAAYKREEQGHNVN